MHAHIHLHDTPLTAISIISEGKFEPVRICFALFEIASKIDPRSAMGGMAPILQCENLGIYGNEVTLLYHCCGDTIGAMYTVLRAFEIGIVTMDEIVAALEQKSTLDVSTIHTAVKAHLLEYGEYEQ